MAHASSHILHICGVLGLLAHASILIANECDIMQIFPKLDRCIFVRGAINVMLDVGYDDNITWICYALFRKPIFPIEML